MKILVWGKSWILKEKSECLQKFSRFLVLGGETCPTQLKDWQNWKSTKRKRIFNIYGITEVSSWATIKEIVEDDLLLDKIPIGTVIDPETLLDFRESEFGEEIFIGTFFRRFIELIILIVHFLCFRKQIKNLCNRWRRSFDFNFRLTHFPSNWRSCGAIKWQHHNHWKNQWHHQSIWSQNKFKENRILSSANSWYCGEFLHILQVWKNCFILQVVRSNSWF